MPLPCLYLTNWRPSNRPYLPAPHLQLLRDLSAPVRKFVTKYKTPLSLFSTANLAFIVWQVLSSAQETRECGRMWFGFE